MPPAVKAVWIVQKLTTHRNGTENEINAYLISHAQDKLFFLLRHNYIRTSIGKEIAKPNHNKMIGIICNKLEDADLFYKLYQTSTYLFCKLYQTSINVIINLIKHL